MAVGRYTQTIRVGLSGGIHRLTGGGSRVVCTDEPGGSTICYIATNVESGVPVSSGAADGVASVCWNGNVLPTK